MLSDKKFDFTDKVVLVTGSSSGIGAAIALQFAQYGAWLVITGRNAANLNCVAGKIKEISCLEPLQIIGDLVDSDFVAKLIPQAINKYGRLDVLVNNAEESSRADTNFDDEKLLEVYDQIMAFNVRSVLQLTQAAMPYLQTTKGNIVNISSVVPGEMLIKTSKAALDMLTKTSAETLAKKGIRVNSVNLDSVLTPFGHSNGDEKKLPKDLKDLTALNGKASPKEVANVVMFLASSDLANMTGSIVLTDSG